MNLSLEGRQALVGGASQGIGRAAAFALAELGASVTCLARDAAALEAVRRELPASHGQRHSVVIADFDKPAELQAAVSGLKDITILVNNTAGPPGGPASAAAASEFETAFRRHLICGQVMVQALVPFMKAAKFGRIVNVISTSVKEPIAGLGVSNTIRGAVAAWAKTLAGELGAFGITVNSVLPGSTRTGRLAAIFEARSAKSGKSLAEVEAEAIAEVPMGRVADASEIANVIAFLCSPAASYVTGVNLPVDGGRTRSM